MPRGTTRRRPGAPVRSTSGLDLASMAEPPVRVCYVVSYFHPLESGAERQALAQGRELARRGHTVHVVTKLANRLPPDEVIDGIQVHRWVRPRSAGPLFGITFVVGVIRALRR